MGQGSEAAKGAAGGAMTGAAIGSIVPGWGTAIGAGIGAVAGGLAGWFGSDDGADYNAMLQQLAAGYQNRVAPQNGAAHQAGQSQLVGDRAALIAQLQAQAAGVGPSAARLQMLDGMDRAVSAQASAAAGAGGRGVNAGAALRGARNNSAAIMSQGNRDMGIMRAQEQLNATGQLGQVIGQGISADNQLSTWNAGALNSREDINLQAQMEMLGLNDRSQLAALGMYSPQQSTGTAILAGGAAATPAITQMVQARQQQQNFESQQAMQQQQQTAWQQQQQAAYMQQLTNSVQTAPSAPNMGNHTWNKQ